MSALRFWISGFFYLISTSNSGVFRDRLIKVLGLASGHSSSCEILSAIPCRPIFRQIDKYIMCCRTPNRDKKSCFEDKRKEKGNFMLSKLSLIVFQPPAHETYQDLLKQF